jgi:hypothetical protein
MLSRRAFLGGVSAAAAAAAIPTPVDLPAPYSIFAGAIGQYNGVIIRDEFTTEILLAAKRLAAAHVQAPENGYYVLMRYPQQGRVI